METQNNSKQGCGCGKECCSPQKKLNLWKKLLGIIIILAAGTIITIKLVGKQEMLPEECCDSTENTTCCSQAKQDTISIKSEQ